MLHILLDWLAKTARASCMKTNDALAGLPEKYDYLSGFPYDGSVIDHVVFSRKQGLFVINLSELAGTVTYEADRIYVEGKSVSHLLRKCLRDSSFIAAKIREQVNMYIPTTPILAFEKAEVRAVRSILGIEVVECKLVTRRIVEAPYVCNLHAGILDLLKDLLNKP